MTTIKICKNCKKVIETEKKTSYEGGREYIQYICPECGYVDNTTINHIHYGNDEIKK